MKVKHIKSIIFTLILTLTLIFISGCQQSDSIDEPKEVDSTETAIEVQPVEAYYASPDAVPGAEGTLDDPMTFQDAFIFTEPGQTIYLLGGTYTFDEQLTISSSINGTEDSMRELFAYGDDPVVFDFSSQAYDPIETGKKPRGIKLDGSYWHIKGITVYGAADNGFLITGNHNIVEDCIAQANKDTGFQISRRSSELTVIEVWPSYNLILNCTSFDNADPDDYEDADGFAAKLTSGEGNVFDGCIAYNNVDDGWDLYTKLSTGPIGSVTLNNCVAFNNGVTTDGTFSPESDGNGFKLGGSTIPVMHYLTNCTAFNNKAAGFTDNSNPGVISLVNCTSYNNSLGDMGAKNNFDFAREAYSANGFINLLSYADEGQTSYDKYRGFGHKNVFYTSDMTIFHEKMRWYDSAIPKSIGDTTEAVTDKDFISLEAPSDLSNIHTSLRHDDGSVNLGDFLKLRPESRLSTMGVEGMAIGSIYSEDNSAIVWPIPPEQSPVVVENMAIEEAILEHEDASKDIAPFYDPEAISGLIYQDGFNQANDDNFSTPEYLANSNDPTIPLYLETGGTPMLLGGYLVLDSARVTIGASYRTSEPGVAPDGCLDLSRPYRLTIELAAFSGLNDRNFMVYIDNNTTKMNNSLHKELSKHYEVPVKDLVEGDLVLEPGIGTENSFIQLRVETGVRVAISKIILEYLD